MKSLAIGILCALSLLAGRAEADEVGRVRAHLRAAQAHLAARDVSGLGAEVAARRRAAVAELDRYIARGEFPRRTDDAYAGPRPRFIDDRGVHCAVGQLIAASGAPQLARAIDAAHEYAYVPDIDEPALRAWADAHGFTVAELAMIQPEYDPPPSPRLARSVIEHGKETIALACARRTEHVPTIELRVSSDAKGVTTATAVTRGPFARCVAARIPSIAPRRPRGGEPFAFTMKVTTAEPARSFREAVARYNVGHRCAPLPGPLVREATVDAVSDRKGLRVTVRTTPRNPAVEACAEADAVERFGPTFGAGIWELRTSAAHAVQPHLDNEGVWRMLVNYGPTTARACGVAALAPRPDKLAIRATGRVGELRLTLAIDGTDDATFRRCLIDHVQPELHRNLGVVLRRDSADRYFRVDVPIDTTFIFDVAPLVRD